MQTLRHRRDAIAVGWQWQLRSGITHGRAATHAPANSSTAAAARRRVGVA
ncbi:MAG: hypothetical protein JWM10_4788, partial [Myxococcaceae bacterium]|nr:hypothetical protein [Myxococcaceae bacterium]